MTSPKRAEPANEHARNLRSIAYDLGRDERSRESQECSAAAAEIERLAARVRELQEALTMKAFCEPEVTVIPRSDRPWLPIADAPRDGTRVELWVGYACYGHSDGNGFWYDDSGTDIGMTPTHYRLPPAGPGSPPLPSG